MTRKTLFNDNQGASAVEFALTLPVFLLLSLGVWQICFGLWAQSALQHGAEMAARCMAVTPTPIACSTPASIQKYAAGHSYGLNPSPSIFIVSKKTTCGNHIPGNKVAADYPVSSLAAGLGVPALNLHAQACYPT